MESKNRLIEAPVDIVLWKNGRDEPSVNFHVTLRHAPSVRGADDQDGNIASERVTRATEAMTRELRQMGLKIIGTEGGYNPHYNYTDAELNACSTSFQVATQDPHLMGHFIRMMGSEHLEIRGDLNPEEYTKLPESEASEKLPKTSDDFRNQLESAVNSRLSGSHLAAVVRSGRGAVRDS